MAHGPIVMGVTDPEETQAQLLETQSQMMDRRGVVTCHAQGVIAGTMCVPHAGGPSPCGVQCAHPCGPCIRLTAPCLWPVVVRGYPMQKGPAPPTQPPPSTHIGKVM